MELATCGRRFNFCSTAKHVRNKGTFDFQRWLPRLGEPSRTWLAQSLVLESPHHQWHTEIARSGLMRPQR
jgi:hypothetical protein